jgi:hypothetical protein
VVCFYERSGRHVRIESRHVNGNAEVFELRITQADGQQTMSWFRDSESFARRLTEVDQELTSDGWLGPLARCS